MKVLTRFGRLVWGGDVDRALRPVLAVSLTGSIAASTLYPFLGIWAIKRLHASQGLPFAYLAGAVLAGLLGYAAGHWSDKLGRRPLILLGWGCQALVPLGLLAVGRNVVLGLALLAAVPIFGSLGNAADQAIVADLVPPDRHEAAYAAVRVASNLGVTIGPPLGGLLLIGSNWSHLWLGTFVLAVPAFALAWRFIPRGGDYAPAGPPTRGSFRVIARDHVFLLFMLSSVFATSTYMATETLLPISATTTHHLAPSLWAFIMVLNPLLVTLAQMRVIRWTARIPPAVKLGLAMPMMGVPFLLLNVDGTAPVIVLVVIVFVFGEMLWVPTSQAVVAALAPEDIRGAYMGAFGGTFSIGFAATPFLGLEVRNHYGDATMWMCVATVGVVAGVLGFVAARGRGAEPAVASAA